MQKNKCLIFTRDQWYIRMYAPNPSASSRKNRSTQEKKNVHASSKELDAGAEDEEAE